jgi:hypothetical protein
MTSLLSYSVLRSLGTRWWKLHEQKKQAISTRSNVRDWTHVLVMDISNAQSICAAGDSGSSSLAASVTVTRLSRGKLGETITLEDYLLISLLCRTSWLLFWLTFKWSSVLLEKLSVVQLLNNFSTFYWTGRFITVLRVFHWFLSWARSTSPYHTSCLSKINFNIILPSTSRSS